VNAGGHVALLGDSIFDNAGYVPGEPSIIEQLREALPAGWHATLLATDGASAADAAEQVTQLPPDVTHLFISAGGNDALNESDVLREPAQTVSDALHHIARVQSRFRLDYETLARRVRRSDTPAVFCTVYDAIPSLSAPAAVALTAFNDVILRTAFLLRAPVIDLRRVCDEESDYSTVSEIEPSSRGGAKIARIVAEVATRHDFSIRRSVVYP